MRILIVSQTYAPDANGQAVFTTRLAEGLSKAGHHVLVLLPSYNLHAGEKTSKGVQLVYLPAISLKPWYPEVRFVITTTGKVARLMRDFQPDLVHIQDHYLLSWIALRAAKRQGIPVAGTNHFLPENILDNLPLPWVPKRLGTSLLWYSWRLVFNRLEVITTPTPTAARILSEQKVSPPILPISCGVDLNQFHPRPHLDKRLWRGKFGIASDVPVFIYVGRVDHEKRLDVFLHAAAKLLSHDFQIVIVGKGLHLKELRQLSQTLGLGERTVFTGYLPQADLPLVLNSADVFVMPSEAELQSIATLEAMASGLPVIAADKWALRELVKDGRNGFLFSVGDVDSLAQTMARMLSCKDDWQTMGKRSREIAGKHDFSRTVKRYLEVYRQILGSVRKPSLPIHSKVSHNLHRK